MRAPHQQYQQVVPQPLDLWAAQLAPLAPLVQGWGAEGVLVALAPLQLLGVVDKVRDGADMGAQQITEYTLAPGCGYLGSMGRKVSTISQQG
jgi:hypothetical protein